MSQLILNQSILHGLRDYTVFYDDFLSDYVTGDRWSLVTTTDGTAVLSDAANGIVVITSAAVTDGNEAALLKSTKETFLFAANKPLIFECRAAITESSTNQANVFFGLVNAAAATTMQDDGAGMVASASGLGFYKVDGALAMTPWSSLSTTQGTEVITTTTVNHTSGSYKTYTCEFLPHNSTTAFINFYIDHVQVGQHSLVFTSATEMNVALYVKDGDSADEDAISVDYVYVSQKR